MTGTATTTILYDVVTAGVGDAVGSADKIAKAYEQSGSQTTVALRNEQQKQSADNRRHVQSAITQWREQERARLALLQESHAKIRAVNLATAASMPDPATKMLKFNNAVTGAAGTLAAFGFQGASSVGMVASLFAQGSPLLMGVAAAAAGFAVLVKGLEHLAEAAERADDEERARFDRENAWAAETLANMKRKKVVVTEEYLQNRHFEIELIKLRAERTQKYIIDLEKERKAGGLNIDTLKENRRKEAQAVLQVESLKTSYVVQSRVLRDQKNKFWDGEEKKRRATESQENRERLEKEEKEYKESKNRSFEVIRLYAEKKAALEIEFEWETQRKRNELRARNADEATAHNMDLFNAEQARRDEATQAQEFATSRRILGMQRELDSKINATTEEKIAVINAIRDEEIAQADASLMRVKQKQAENYLLGSTTAIAAHSAVETERQRVDQFKQMKKEEADFAVAQLERVEEAAAMAAKEQRVLSVSTLTYGVAMTAVQPVMDLFTAQVAKLGELNRENYQDMFQFSEDLPAIIAKEAQTIMAGIAVKAAGMAFMETAEAIREGATGIGMAAIGSPTSTEHFASAAGHAAAAAAYGALGGVGAGGAFAMGMTRGKGGLFDLTKEEKEKRDGVGGGSISAGDGGRGPSAGRGGGVGGGVGGGQPTVNYTIIMGPGTMMAPGDDRKTRRVIAQAHRRNQRDEFARLRAAP